PGAPGGAPYRGVHRAAGTGGVARPPLRSGQEPARGPALARGLRERRGVGGARHRRAGVGGGGTRRPALRAGPDQECGPPGRAARRPGRGCLRGSRGDRQRRALLYPGPLRRPRGRRSVVAAPTRPRHAGHRCRRCPPRRSPRARRPVCARGTCRGLARGGGLRGDPTAARVEVQRAVAQGDSSAATLVLYGELLVQANRLRDAELAYRASARDSALGPLAVYRRARVLVRLGDLGATDALSGFAAVYPADTAAPTALYVIGDVLVDRGDWPGAARWFGELLARYPADLRS